MTTLYCNSCRMDVEPVKNLPRPKIGKALHRCPRCGGELKGDSRQALPYPKYHPSKFGAVVQYNGGPEE